MTTVRTLLIGLLMAFAAGCATDTQYNTAIRNLDAEWRTENGRLLDRLGSRRFEIGRADAFAATQEALRRLGMIIEQQDMSTGYVFVTANAPLPLTMTEWAEVQRADTPAMRDIIGKDVGPLSWFATLDPSVKDVLVNIFVREEDGGSRVSVGMRLRDRKNGVSRIRRSEPPPTALRMGLEKFWAAFERQVADRATRKFPIVEARAGIPAAQPGPAIPAAAGPAARNPDGVAVIIGNTNYFGALPAVEFARRDADAVRDFVTGTLGFRPGNVIDLRDASRAELAEAIGNERTHRGKLWRWVRPGESDVLVFYAGHGVPGLKDREKYLLPVDADPATPEINGYPLSLLYGNLARLDARSVTVLLETCFSGETPAGWLVGNVSGLGLRSRADAPVSITVLAAARDDQVASWESAERHGLFTKYLLAGLGGEADRVPYGNGDGAITLQEAKAYLDREMSYAARRHFGREQNAVAFGDPATVLVRRSHLVAGPR